MGPAPSLPAITPVIFHLSVNPRLSSVENHGTGHRFDGNRGGSAGAALVDYSLVELDRGTVEVDRWRRVLRALGGSLIGSSRVYFS